VTTLSENSSFLPSGDDELTVRDTVLQYWNLLEYLIDQNAATSRTSETSIRGSTKPVLQGFELMALAEQKSPIWRK
jgi:hypothetical protein